MRGFPYPPATFETLVIPPQKMLSPRGLILISSDSDPLRDFDLAIAADQLPAL